MNKKINKLYFKCKKYDLKNLCYQKDDLLEIEIIQKWHFKRKLDSDVNIKIDGVDTSKDFKKNLKDFILKNNDSLWIVKNFNNILSFNKYLFLTDEHFINKIFNKAISWYRKYKRFVFILIPALFLSVAYCFLYKYLDNVLIFKTILFFTSVATIIGIFTPFSKDNYVKENRLEENTKKIINNKKEEDESNEQARKNGTI